MPLHLIKVAVGAETVEDLVKRQKQWHVQDDRGRTVFRVRTRQTPRRGEEVLDGGALYWIIKGFVRARQEVWAIESAVLDGRPYTLIHLNPKVITTELHPRGPHQGWRYLKAEDAPADLSSASPNITDLPPKLLKSLRELALI